MLTSKSLRNIQKSIILFEEYWLSSIFNDFPSTYRMQAIGMTTSWHEGHQKFEVWRKNKGLESKMEQELTQANQELKIVRAQRLKELYQQEMEQ